MATGVNCRSCGHVGLEPVLDLGRTPLADRLVSAPQLAEQEPAYPLQVAFCSQCSLLQITVQFMLWLGFCPLSEDRLVG